MFGGWQSWFIVSCYRGYTVDEMAFNRQLSDLVKQIGGLGDSPFKTQLLRQTTYIKEQRDKGQKLVSDIQDTLGVLQVNLKYMVFDLEATRRENKQLRNILEVNDIDPEADTYDDRA